MPVWRPHSGIWGSLGAILLTTLVYWGYEALRPLSISSDSAEPVLVVAGLALFVALAVGLTQRRAWQRNLRELVDHLIVVNRQSQTLDASAWPPALRSLGEQIEQVVAQQRTTVEQQKKTIEFLQKEHQLAEITLQSLLGRADSEEGQSHSLVHRPGGSGEFSLGGAARDMIARLTPGLTWLAATPILQKFLGLTIVELNGRSILDVVSRDDALRVKEAFEKALRQGEGHSIEFRLQLRGGAERNVQIDVLTRYTTEGKPLHLRCHFQDITERIISDRELRLRTDQLSQANDRLQRINRDLERLKESYRDLYHNAPAMYFSLDPSGRFAATNETMLKSLGYVREDLHDKPYIIVLNEESRKKFQEHPDIFHRAAEVEAQWIKKNGTVIDVWIRTTPVLDADGRFVRSRSAAQDVTERNRLASAIRAQAEELQRTNDQLRRTNRELDDFTYVVSHDLKEPLRTLQAFSNFLSEDYGTKLGVEGKEYIDHLIQASKRLGLLIDDLLTLSRAGRVLNTSQVFDLAEPLTTMRSDLANLIQRRGATLRIEGNLPLVAGDAVRVTQLLTNLVSNGLKYNNHPKPEVAIGCWRPGAVPANGMTGSKLQPEDAGRVVLFVRDNGIGIDPRFHEQIFGIFRRLHLPEEYEGTGAGLAICQKIVEAHGGRIWVESLPGQGATFYFTMPPAPGAVSTFRMKAPKLTQVLVDAKP